MATRKRRSLLLARYSAGVSPIAHTMRTTIVVIQRASRHTPRILVHVRMPTVHRSRACGRANRTHSPSRESLPCPDVAHTHRHRPPPPRRHRHTRRIIVGFLEIAMVSGEVVLAITTVVALLRSGVRSRSLVARPHRLQLLWLHRL